MNCLSISYKTAPSEIREQYAFSQEEKEDFLKKVIGEGMVEECVVLATCNRSEIYFTGGNKEILLIQETVALMKKKEVSSFLKYVHIFCEEKAKLHLYQVTCGLDSMVLGEDEILGQVKEAFFLAQRLGATGYYFNTIFKDAITCAKKIKTDTNLSKIPVSIGTLVANEIVHFPKKEKTVVIIGITGKMGSIVRKNIQENPQVHLIGTVRKHYTTLRENYEGITYIEYEQRYSVMDEADIIVSVTTSPHYTITYEELKQSIKQTKHRLLIDLALPFDIDKKVTTLDGVNLYDLDYFEAVAKENNEHKLSEVNCVSDIIVDHMNEIEKTIEFHKFLEDMPRIKKIFATKSFEKILYEIRNQSTSKEFETIVAALRKL